MTVLAQKTPVRIGIVLDGPSPRNESALRILKQEIQIVLENEYEVSFPGEKILVDDWKAEGVRVRLESLLQDPSIDAVVALGVVSSQEASRQSSLGKPVFAPYVVDPELQGLPFETRRLETGRAGQVETFRVSGVPNLNFILFGGNLDEDVERFREVVSFSKLAVLVMAPLSEAVPSLERAVVGRLAPLQLERIDWIPVSENVEGALDQLPRDSQAVLVTPLLHLSPSSFEVLVRGLNQRNLPTLSSWGRDEVDQGLLATLHSSEDPVRRSRRIALRLQEALEGQDPGDMSIEYQRDTRLILNMATARQIGVSPRFKLLLEAELLHEQSAPTARTLSLAAVVREATTINLDLAAADRNIAAGEQRVLEARSPLLPQVALSAGVNVVDSDRARLLPTLAETQYSTALSASQLVYSDRAWANHSIEKSFQNLRLEERAELRLDVVLEAAERYLDLLRALTVEGVQKDNLQLTRSNLNLASSRVDIGVAGREELFRWESQVATNQRNVVDAGAAVNQARIAVNRVLHRALDENFGTVEATLNDPDLIASFESIEPFLDNPRAFSLFADFMTGESLSAAPELRQFDAVIRARERELKAEKRSFFLPEISLTGGITALSNQGVGSNPIPGLNNTDWFVGLNAGLPLFQGTDRYAKIRRLKLQLEELSLQRQAVSERVEQRIRSLLEATNASYIGIELSRAEAEAARRNLQLVTDSYAAGVVGILSLLDAQNQALVAELVAADAVYRYLSDLMSVQRATGRFDYFRSPQERQDFLSRLRGFYFEQGVEVKTP